MSVWLCDRLLYCRIFCLHWSLERCKQWHGPQIQGCHAVDAWTPVVKSMHLCRQLLHDWPARHHWRLKSQRSRHLNMKDWNMWLSLVTKLMWYHSSQQPWPIKRSSTKAGSERWVTEVVQWRRSASVQVARQPWRIYAENIKSTYKCQTCCIFTRCLCIQNSGLL